MPTTAAKLAFVLIFCMAALAHNAHAQELPCTRTELLDRVASDILVMPQEPTPDDLARILQEQGGDSTRIYVSIRSVAARKQHLAWVQQQKSRADGVVRCGQADNSERSVVVASIEGGTLQYVESDVYKVVIYKGFRDGLILMRDGRGKTLQRKVGPGDMVKVPRNLQKPIALQLVATGRDGPRPIALRWIGQPPQQTGKVPTENVEVWVKGLRAETKGEPLRYNRVLSDASEQHAREVCESGKVAHYTAGRNPVDRLKVLGMTAEIVGEIVGRAVNLQKALESLAQSPTHRLTVQDDRFTDYGYGEVASSDGKICLVVSFAAWPTLMPN